LKIEPSSIENLTHILQIVQRSKKVTNAEIAVLAREKCETLKFSDNIAIWFATWIGVEPELAIPTFTFYLDELALSDSDRAREISMRVVVNLVGDRNNGAKSRDKYKTPNHLKDLYLLMHQYIKVDEDIDRSGTGVFSPHLRDHAQEARERLFVILKGIPGKDGYFGEVDHLIPWQIDHLINWRPVVENASRSDSKLVNKSYNYS
jgi:hypothetical protein